MNSVNLARRLVACVLLAALLVPLAGTGSVAGQGAGGDATIRCEPAHLHVDQNEEFTFDIYVENVTDLYGADVRLTFDPAFLNVRDSNMDEEGTQIELLYDFLYPDFPIQRTADNMAGTINYAAVQLNPREPVSGSGSLARVHAVVLGAGESTISFSQATLADRNGSELPSTTQDCTITTQPDPSIVVLPLVLGAR